MTVIIFETIGKGATFYVSKPSGFLTKENRKSKVLPWTLNKEMARKFDSVGDVMNIVKLCVLSKKSENLKFEDVQ